MECDDALNFSSLYSNESAILSIGELIIPELGEFVSSVKVINTTLILKFVSTLAKLQHENSSNGTHQSARSVKLHTRMRIGYMLISRDKLY